MGLMGNWLASALWPWLLWLCLSALAFGTYCFCGLIGSCSGEWLLLLCGLMGSKTAFGTYYLVGLTGSLLVGLVLASGSMALALTGMALASQLWHKSVALIAL